MELNDPFFEHYVINEHIIEEKSYKLPKRYVQRLIESGLGRFGPHIPKTIDAKCDFILFDEVLPLADLAKTYYLMGWSACREWY